MAEYGIAGSVKINNKVIAHISDWSLEQSREIKDGSFFGGNGKEKKVGIKDWTASFNGQVDFETESGQVDIQNAFNAGQEVTVQLYLNKTAYYEGKAFFESLNIDNSAEGEYNIEASLAGNKGIELKGVTGVTPSATTTTSNPSR